MTASYIIIESLAFKNGLLKMWLLKMFKNDLLTPFKNGV